jgi:hypothetical protein
MMGWAEHVTHVERMINACNILVCLSKGRYYSGGKGEERR